MSQRLETGECDFCFLSTPPIKLNIKWRSLLTEELLLAVPTNHRLSKYSCIPLREVAHEAVVIEKVGGDLRNLIDTYCQQAGFTPRIAYEMDEPTVLLEFVKARLGVTFVPAFAKKRIEEQDLRALRLTNPTCRRTFGMTWHQEHYLSLAARTFRQFITEYFAHLEQEAPAE